MRRSSNIPTLFLFFVLPLAISVPWCAVEAQDHLRDLDQALFAISLQKWDRALELLNKVVAADPKAAGAYYSRGIVYSKKGEYDKSIEDLKKVVQLNPNHFEAYHLLAVVYQIKKDYKSALATYRTALTHAKDPTIKKALEKMVAEMEAKTQKGK